MDQAEKLRRIMYEKKQTDSHPFRVITVSSGKGGVGKTNFTANLAIALQKRGQRVAILDADFGMADVDILFGIKTRNTIYDLLYNDKNIEEIAASTPEGIKIIPGGSGILELSEIDEEKRNKLLSEFSKIKNIDILLVDTGAGISRIMLNFIEASDDAIIITNSEPTSLTDAYGLIKVILKNNVKSSMSLIINRVRNVKEAKETFDKISNTVEIFLNESINYLGFILEDTKVGQAVREQQPLLNIYPKSEAGICIQNIASKLLGEYKESKSNSVKEYFNKLLRVMRR